MTVIHPKPGPKGQKIIIHKPSTPSAAPTWQDAEAVGGSVFWFDPVAGRSQHFGVYVTLNPFAERHAHGNGYGVIGGLAEDSYGIIDEVKGQMEPGIFLA